MEITVTVELDEDQVDEVIAEVHPDKIKELVYELDLEEEIGEAYHLKELTDNPVDCLDSIDVSDAIQHYGDNYLDEMEGYEIQAYFENSHPELLEQLVEKRREKPSLEDLLILMSTEDILTYVKKNRLDDLLRLSLKAI